MTENTEKRTIDVRNQHLFDQSLFNVYEKNYYNLSVGAPGPDLLKYCTEFVPIATEHLLKKGDHSQSYHIFQYGCDIGNYSFRLALAKFLSDGYNAPVDCKNLVQTGGASHGLHLILSTLVDLAGIIYVDEVTYMIALETFQHFSSMKVVPVPLNADGVDVKQLSALVEQHKFKSKDKIFWGMYYTMPTYHNPTGIVFSESICKELVALSQEHDFLIACDDVYNLLTYDSECPPKRLFAYDNETNSLGNVISNGSFSKIMSPGIRVGWMECPTRCVEVLHASGVLRSGGAVNNYSAGIIESLIDLGLAQRQLKIYQAVYKSRMELSCDILRKNLPENCNFTEPKGGYFIWIELPKNVKANDANLYCCEKYKVLGLPSDSFSVTKSVKNFLRITIGFQESAVLQVAVAKLCQGLTEFIENQK